MRFDASEQPGVPTRWCTAPRSTALGTAKSCREAAARAGPAEPGLPGNAKAEFGVREQKMEMEKPLCPQHKAQLEVEFAYWLLQSHFSKCRHRVHKQIVVNRMFPSSWMIFAELLE